MPELLSVQEALPAASGTRGRKERQTEWRQWDAVSEHSNGPLPWLRRDRSGRWQQGRCGRIHAGLHAWHPTLVCIPTDKLWTPLALPEQAAVGRASDGREPRGPCLPSPSPSLTEAENSVRSGRPTAIPEPKGPTSPPRPAPNWQSPQGQRPTHGSWFWRGR